MSKEEQIELGRKIEELYECKVIIECDETHHKYDVKNDKERENYIKENIDCTFIRYDPYSKDFNIFKVINKIYKTIKSLSFTQFTCFFNPQDNLSIRLLY